MDQRMIIAQTLDKSGQLSVWTYAEKGYCPKHPAPAGPVEPAQPGRCSWSTRLLRGHDADETWEVPRRGVRLCRRHFAEYVAEGIRRGRFGEK